MAKTSTRSLRANRRLMAQISDFVTSVKAHWHDVSGGPVYPPPNRVAIPVRATVQRRRPPRTL